MVRICPFCRSKLGLYDRYFCTSCGNTLPAELTESKRYEKKVIEHEDAKVFHGPKIDLKKIIYPLLLLVSTVTLAFVWYSLLLPPIIGRTLTYTLQKNAEVLKTVEQGIPGKTVVTPAVITSQNVITPSCSFSSGSLIDPDLEKLVPYDVDLYMESDDPKAFLRGLIDSGIVSDSKFKAFYDAQKVNFLGPAGFFVTKYSSGYIYGIAFMLKDVSGKDKLSGEYNISFSGNYAVLVTDKSAMEEIKDVVDGLGKNLALNPIYASAKLTLPKEGKLFILPITKNGRGFLFQLLDKNLTGEMSVIVNSFLDSKLDYAVVL